MHYINLIIRTAKESRRQGRKIFLPLHSLPVTTLLDFLHLYKWNPTMSIFLYKLVFSDSLMMLPVIVCSLLLLIWSWSDQICALLMDIWVVASILGFTNNTAECSHTYLWYTYVCISDGGIQRSMNTGSWVVCMLSFGSYRQSRFIPILK